MLANVFLHYGFDMWMARDFPAVRFERCVDDAVVHCVTQQQAEMLRDAYTTAVAESDPSMLPVLSLPISLRRLVDACAGCFTTSTAGIAGPSPGHGRQACQHGARLGHDVP